VVNLKIGRKFFEFGFIQWGEGAALLSAVQDETGATVVSAQRMILGAAPDDRILRLFRPRELAMN